MGKKAFFSIDPVNVFVKAANYTDIDCSPYIPEGATGVVLHVHVHTNETRYYVRKKGSTDDYYGHCPTYSHHWIMVGVDENRKFQLRNANTDSSPQIYLVGYTMPGVVFFDNAYDKSPSIINSWQEIDCSVECPNAKALIFHIFGSGSTFGLRMKGSSDDLKQSYVYGGPIGAIVGCDENQKCEIYKGDSNQKFLLIGYVTDDVDIQMLTNNIDITPDQTGVWKEIDVGCDFAFLQVISQNAHKYAIRKKGSTQDIYAYCEKHFYSFVGTDSGKIEIKIENTDCKIYLVGQASPTKNFAIIRANDAESYGMNGRKLARLSNGDFYVVFVRQHNGKNCIFIKKSEDKGLTWIDEELVAEAEPSYYDPDFREPCIAVDSNDNIHVIWSGYTGQYSGYKVCHKVKTLGGWSSIEEVCSGEGFSPSFCIDSNDNIHVIWRDGRTNRQIKYRRKVNGAWQSEILLDDVDDPDRPDICVDSNDNVHTIWYANRKIIYRACINNSWQSKQIISESNDYQKYNPCIAVDKQDNLYVVWEEGSPCEIKLRKKIASEWQDIISVTPNPSTNQLRPKLALDNNDNLYVIWENYTGSGSYAVCLRKYDGEWSDIETIVECCGVIYPNPIWAKFPDNLLYDSILQEGWAFVYYKKICSGDVRFVGQFSDVIPETKNYNYSIDIYLIRCIDSNLSLDSLLFPFQRKLVRKSDGSFIAVYHKKINDVCQIFLASSNDGISWSFTQITNSSYHQRYPSIAIDAEDNIHLVWLSQVDSDTYKIAYKCQLNGQWQDTEIIGDAVENSAPAIAFSNKNDDIIYVSWHNGLLNNKISIRKKVNGTWQSPHTFSTGIEQLFPCITVDNDGKYHLVWSIKKAEDQPYQIVYSNEDRFPDRDVLAESEGNNYPIILIDLNNNIYVCWRDKGYGNNPNYYNIVYRKNDGNGWTDIQNVSDEDHNQLAPSVSATIQNDVYAIWSGLGWQNNPTFYNIQYRKSGQSIQSVTDIDRHQWFPNAIYSLYPKVFGIRTNVPKQGFGFIWIDDIYTY